MIDTPLVGEQTSHSDMLTNCREALNTLLADQQTQQSSVDALHEIARRQEEDLATHQQSRTSLLEGLRTAQLSSNKAQAARDLAAGGKTAKKREAEYTQAVSAVNALQQELLALAQADAQLKEEQAGTQSILQDAEENLQRIVERVSIAQSIHDEELDQHREEIRSTWLEKLDRARGERDRLKAQVVDAELTVQQIQAGMIESLRGWPQFAEQELDKTLEIAPALAEQLLDTYLHFSAMVEQHSQGLVRGDPLVLKALTFPIPVHVFATSGPREAQREAYKRNYKSPGRAIDPQLWGYDTHLGEVGELRALRQSEHRRQVIHDLIYSQREIADTHSR